LGYDGVAESEIRTRTCCILGAVPLPVGLSRRTGGGNRTHTRCGLNAVPLPIGLPQHSSSPFKERVNGPGPDVPRRDPRFTVAVRPRDSRRRFGDWFPAGCGAPPHLAKERRRSESRWVREHHHGSLMGRWRVLIRSHEGGSAELSRSLCGGEGSGRAGVGGPEVRRQAQQRLYFFPEPQGHGSLRPTLSTRRYGAWGSQSGQSVLASAHIFWKVPIKWSSTAESR
jgi:hypothetical protein